MYFEHDLCCSFTGHFKKLLQYLDYEFHGGEIVIEQDHLVHFGRFGLGPFRR